MTEKMTAAQDTIFQVSMGHNWRTNLIDALKAMGGYVEESFIEATECYVWAEFEDLHDSEELEKQLAEKLNCARYPQVLCYHDECLDEQEIPND